MAKTRKGRKRKAGARQANGRLKDQPTGITGAEFQRIRTDVVRMANDPRLGTQLGRLGLFRELTDTQVAAGLKVAEVYGRFERQHGRRRATASPSYEIGYGRAPCDDDDAAAEERAFRELQELLSPLEREMVERLCVDDLFTPAYYLAHVRNALGRIGALYRLAGAPRRSKSAGKGAKVVPKVPLRTATGANAAAKVNTDRLAFIEELVRLRPDMDEMAASAAFDEYRARSDRERFRADKARGRI